MRGNLWEERLSEESEKHAGKCPQWEQKCSDIAPADERKNSDDDTNCYSDPCPRRGKSKCRIVQIHQDRKTKYCRCHTYPSIVCAKHPSSESFLHTFFSIDVEYSYKYQHHKSDDHHRPYVKLQTRDVYPRHVKRWGKSEKPHKFMVYFFMLHVLYQHHHSKDTDERKDKRPGDHEKESWWHVRKWENLREICNLHTSDTNCSTKIVKIIRS